VVDEVLDLAGVAFCVFDACAGWRLDIDGELAGVGLGKKGQAYEPGNA
jgi:hypothetical protein